MLFMVRCLISVLLVHIEKFCSESMMLVIHFMVWSLSCVLLCGPLVSCKKASAQMFLSFTCKFQVKLIPMLFYVWEIKQYAAKRIVKPLSLDHLVNQFGIR